jgi:hypothetical protein
VTCDVDGTEETFTTTFYDEYVHCNIKLNKYKTSNVLKILELSNYTAFIKYLSGVIFTNSNDIHVETRVVKSSSSDEKLKNRKILKKCK